MESLLYLAHRLPYPPNKGDKSRSFNVVRLLAQRYRVFLGCFVDSPEDAGQVHHLSRWCSEVCAVPLSPRLARLRSLRGLLCGEALTLPFYHDARLQRWVNRVVTREGIGKAIAFSTPMAQYMQNMPYVRTVVDLVDVDSAKWMAFSENHGWPLSAVYRRESRRLLDFERRAVARSAAAVLVTRAEVELFERLAPECSARVHAIEMGVDTDFFAPREEVQSPFKAAEVPVVFTGVMDYWPNADAVIWFAREVLPALLARVPNIRFYVVGMNPLSSVCALAANRNVVVTGKVPDVRPYLQHAAVVVAPLRVARGVQTKILEAMSMARPVVVSAAAAGGLTARASVDFELAAGAPEFVECTIGLLDAARGRAMGERARTRMRATYSWERSAQRFQELLEEPDFERRPTGDFAISNSALVG